MSTVDKLLLVFGIALPLAVLQFIFAAGLIGLAIIVVCVGYCRIEKALVIKFNLDRLLLRQIRR
jgi:hypothetical protein